MTGVDTTSDLRHAKVFVSVLGKQAEKEATLEGLRSALGYLQGVINDELHLKRTPTLEFVYDESIDLGMRIHVLLRESESAMGLDIATEDTAPQQAGEPAEPTSGDAQEFADGMGRGHEGAGA